jgi:hypothetical protein
MMLTPSPAMGGDRANGEVRHGTASWTCTSYGAEPVTGGYASSGADRARLIRVYRMTATAVAPTIAANIRNRPERR